MGAQTVSYTHLDVYKRQGYVPKDQNEGDFAIAMRAVCEPIWGRKASEVSMGKVLLQLFDVTEQFGMQLRPELVLLQKTMVQVEGCLLYTSRCV